MKFLNRSQVIEKTSLSKTALYALINQGNFPYLQSVKLGFSQMLMTGFKNEWMQHDLKTRCNREM